MKLTKILIFALVFTLISCGGSDDNNDNDTTPITQNVTASVDVAALMSSGGTDASAFANFGQPAGVSNADFTTSVITDDRIIFRGTPTSSSNQRILVKRIEYVSGPDIIDDIIVFVDPSESGVQDDAATVYDIFDGGNDGDEVKYNLIFTIETNGVEDPLEYFIDPKIRIRSFR